MKTRPLQSQLLKKLCEEMGGSHKSLILFTEVFICHIFET